jgi:hypothetical protein
MTAQDILVFTREWAYAHGFPTRECYPIVRNGEVLLFYVRDRGMYQP